MKRIKSILTLAFVLVMAAVSMSSCFCAYDPYYTRPVVIATTPSAYQRAVENEMWQAQQRAVARQQAIENEYWQRSQR